MSVEVVGEVVARLTRVKWVWSSSGWDVVSAALGLSPIVRQQYGEDERTEYEFLSGLNLFAHSTRGHLLFAEVPLEQNWDPVQDMAPATYEVLVADFQGKCALAQQLVEGVLGSPLCAGPEGTPGFARRYGAAWMAIWDHGDARFLLQQLHEPWETGFAIRLVVDEPP